MPIPTTGLVFFFGAFVFIYLARKFQKLYKSENNLVARNFSYGFLFLGLYYFIDGLPSLFLIADQAVWRIIAPVYTFFISTGWSIIIYTVFSSKFKNLSKLVAVSMLSFVIFNTGVVIFYPPYFFFSGGSLDWEVGPAFTLSIFSTLPLLIILLVIFFQQARITQDKTTKIRSFGLGLFIIWTLLGMINDFFLTTVLNLPAVSSDINNFIVFSILAITLIKTWKTVA